MDFQWSSGHIVALGSRLSNDGGDDWGPRVTKLQAMLHAWCERKLSFLGRAVIVNVLSLSIFWYLANIVTLPNKIVKKVNSLIYSFVWGKKREWLSRDTVSQSIARGG